MTEGVRERVRDRVAIDVDRVNLGRAVEGELHGEDPAAATDVEAALALADALAEEVLPAEVAAVRRNEDSLVDRELRERQRADDPTLLVEPRRRHGDGSASASGSSSGVGRRRPGVVPSTAFATAAMWSGVVPQQPPMICAPSARHSSASSAYSAGPIALVEAPLAAAEVTEVRIDAERQAREVAQPREHPANVLDRKAVDEQRPDAHLLEAPRGAAEEIALGRAPVLAVDTADSVSAAAEREPHRQPGLEQQLDRLEGRGVTDQGQRLEQDQVGRGILERARKQRHRLALLGRRDVLGDRERDRTLVGASLVDRGLPRQLHPAAGDVEPVRGVASTRGAAALRVGVERIDHVLVEITSQPSGDVPAVNLAHRLGRRVERPGPPQLLGRPVPVDRMVALELGRDPAVEDDAAIGGEQLLESVVRARRRE